MADKLAEGKEFRSFAALQEAVHNYEQTCFAQLSRTDSRTIENEEHRRNSKSFNPSIKYSFVTFTCAFGGKPYVSRSTGIRNSKPRIKCNCPVILKCFATTDGQKLVVRHSQLDCHNHETSEESFKSLPRGRLMDEETELEICKLIEGHENKKLARKLVKEKLIEETGRKITYKDIQNIEKRMSRKKEKESNGEEYDENEEFDDASDEKGSDQEEEDKEGDEVESGEEDLTGDEANQENGTADQAGDGKNRDDSKSGGNTNLKAKQSPTKNNSKAPSTPARKTKKETNTRASTGRPRRAIREPRRFRDPGEDVSPPPGKRRRTSESGEEEDDMEVNDSQSSAKKDSMSPASPAKERKPGGAKRGRKPLNRNSQTKIANEAESDGDSVSKTKKVEENTNHKNKMLEIEERRLQMQEEMLKLQRQSILLLQNVVERLDRVEESQRDLTDLGKAPTNAEKPIITVTEKPTPIIITATPDAEKATPDPEKTISDAGKTT